ncbi:nucleotidyltransferase family protein [Nitratifractor salsuginis]|uniref:DNA polymerase beta domain protein region n=1 Tax=Nitratifractor salsuginis (strain DSM 16511 / JCM 12458 / E9I37-1) TaxID=749222 RepID=E6X2D2_NITSE|nr:nucleotidyltransferase domain-containing protein [Nitratifractor salsuginis]ADV46067.1 DNA polymerase beta domain protein region [Nitratifractor salsuginis DSM 16511]
MRLSEREIQTIKRVVAERMGSDAKIYLFGSRLDDTRKGGDIDLFILAEKVDLETKLLTRAKLKALLHKPVDIVCHQNFSRSIEQEALKGQLL